MQTDKSNTQLNLTVSDLKLKMRAKDMELRKETRKVSPALLCKAHVLLFELEYILMSS